MRRCCLCTLWEMEDVPIPPCPYRKSHGNICGYSWGLFYMDSILSLWPTARILPPEFRCFSTIAFSAFGVHFRL
jgi:hypothetical protein